MDKLAGEITYYRAPYNATVGTRICASGQNVVMVRAAEQR